MKNSLFFGVAFTLLFLLVASNLSASSVGSRLKSGYLKPNKKRVIVLDIINDRSGSVPQLIEFIGLPHHPSLSHSQRLADIDARVSAINILGELKEKNALNALENILTESNDSSFIFNSARSIGNIGGEKAFNILSKALKKALEKKLRQSDLVKRAAILGLGLCKDARAIPRLLNELRNEQNSDLTRIYAAGSLGLVGSREGLEFAKTRLTSGSSRMKLKAIQALGLIGDESVVEALKKEAKRSTYAFRSTAGLSLLKITYARLFSDEKAAFLSQQLNENPRNRHLIRWATQELADLDSLESREVLEYFSQNANQAMEHVKSAADLRLRIVRSLR